MKPQVKKAVNSSSVICYIWQGSFKFAVSEKQNGMFWSFLSGQYT